MHILTIWRRYLAGGCGGGGGRLVWQAGSPGAEPRVSSFRKWIARRLRVLHTHTTYAVHTPPSRQAKELADWATGQKNRGDVPMKVKCRRE